MKPNDGPPPTQYGLLERQTYMLRIQADPAHKERLKRMNSKFTWTWATACGFVALIFVVVVVSGDTRPLFTGGSVVTDVVLSTLIVAFVGTGVWGVVINYQNQHWIGQQAHSLWQQERVAKAARHPWPPPSDKIEY